MSVRMPTQPGYQAADIRLKRPDGTVKQVGFVFVVLGHTARAVWMRETEQEGESNLLDWNGEILYDLNGEIILAWEG